MPLSWETVSVPLVGGLDTKTDEKAVLPTKLTVLENGEFTKGGSLRKRFGHTKFSPELIDRTDVDDLRGVFALGDGLLEASGSRLYSLDETTSRLLEVGAYDPMTHTAEAAAVSSAEQTSLTVATVSGITVYAWVDSRGGVRGAVYNDDTGAPYDADWTIAASDAERPHAVAIGENIVVFYYVPSTDNILARLIRPAAVSASLATASVDVVTDVASTGVYDVIAGPTEAYLFYASDNTVVTGSRIIRVNASAVATQFATVTSTVVTKAAITYNALDGLIYLAWYDGTDLTAGCYTASDLTPSDAGTAVDTIANVRNIALAPSAKTPQSFSRNGASLAYEVSAASASDHTVTVYADFYNGGGAFGKTYLHAGLASGGFLSNGNTYFILGHESRTGVQHSYYLLRCEPQATSAPIRRFVGRVLSGEGVGVVNTNHLCHVGALGDNQLQVALGFRRRLEVKDTVSPVVPGQAAFLHKGLKRVVFQENAVPGGVEFGKALYLTGSQLWVSDGAQVVESGFHMFPDVLTSDITTTATVDVDITIGVYSYRVYYEWTTATGERFRSAAISRAHTTAGGNRIQILIPTLTFTNKVELDGLTDVSIVVYRSEVNKSQLYYRVSSVSPGAANPNGYLENDTTALTVTFTDGMSDATLLTQELDYLSFSERPHLAPEGPEYVNVVQNRLWLIGGGSAPDSVRYSKIRFDGTPAEFTTANSVTEAPQFGGSPVSLGYINQTPVVFKETSVYALEGEGPDNTGQSGEYIPRSVSTDFGTSEVTYSATEGVYFKAPEGIHLLDQSGNVTYVGAEVEAYNGLTCTSILGVPNTNQIIFLMTSGVSLMFDTFYKQWSAYTNHSGLGAAVYRGTDYVYLRSNGEVYQRNTSLYTDAGVSYKFKFRTAPLHLKDELQGFWRCRKLGVLGEYKSSHRLQVGVYYNRDEAPFEVFEWLPDDVLELGTWGSEATWGEVGTLWGGSLGSRDYRFTHRLKRQKCETIRFEFEDLSTGAVPGASFELAELNLEVGLRTGIGRLAAVRKV